MKFLVILSSFLFFSNIGFAGAFKSPESIDDVEALKGEIVKIAESFFGQGDPSQELQRQLDPYVKKLTEMVPQKPVAERLDLLAGRWQQIWGPYEYANDDGSVDPTLDPNHIYQVVFKDGFYYNVSNNLQNDNTESQSTGLLRGEFSLTEGNVIRVRFTDLYAWPHKPSGDLLYTDLPELAEKKELEGMEPQLPSIVVKLFFNKGELNEVYTDETLRLAYGNTDNGKDRLSLYVMKRVK